jgi:radical SAM superfamily enzyme YgiQ (UPF0313 family)
VNLVSEDLLKRMRRAGCVEVGYGFESGSQQVLDAMKKQVTIRQAAQAIRMTRSAGITVYGSFIFGMPGETIDTIKETLVFIRTNRLPIFRFFYATAYPRTELYEIAKRMGRLPADEDRYLESLGEMRTTFLVNFTDFPDKEFTRLKQWSEFEARRNMGLGLKWHEFVGDWKRRTFLLNQNFKENGFASALRLAFRRLFRGFGSRRKEQ